MKKIFILFLSIMLVGSMNIITLAQDEEEVPQPKDPVSQRLGVRDSRMGTVKFGRSRVQLVGQLAAKKIDFGVAGKLTKGSAIVLMDQNRPSHAVCLGSGGLAEITFRGSETVKFNRPSPYHKVLFQIDAKIEGKIQRMGRSDLNLLVGLLGADGRLLKTGKAQYLLGGKRRSAKASNGYFSIPYNQADQAYDLELLMNSSDLPRDGRIDVVFKLQAMTHGRDAMVIMRNIRLSDLNIKVLQAKEL